MLAYGEVPNPPSVYEGIAAGIPIFINREAVGAYHRRPETFIGKNQSKEIVKPRELLDQKFVKVRGNAMPLSMQYPVSHSKSDGNS